MASDKLKPSYVKFLDLSVLTNKLSEPSIIIKDMSQDFKKLTIDNKSLYINKMFAKIAKKYDLLNNLMTFSLHNKWKEEAIDLVLKEIDSPKLALDLCSGTGDLAVILNKKIPGIKITCVDNCTEMLEIAKAKAENLKIKNIDFLETDCENLPFYSWSFDIITVGFGLRNLVNKEQCLSNIFGFLKPGGVFSCVDLGHPANPLWQRLYSFYFCNLVPKLGELFAKDKEAYTYLPESLKTWYKQAELKKIILQTGFKKCYFKNLLGGAVAIHVAVK